MAKEKKITFKYFLYKEKKPDLNDKGLPLHRLYVRVTYDKKSTKFALADASFYFLFPSLSENDFDKFDLYKKKYKVEKFENLLSAVIRYESNKRPESYSIANIKNRLDYYGMPISHKLDEVISLVILENLENTLTYKQYVTSEDVIREGDGIVGKGGVSWEWLFLYYFIESEFDLDIEKNVSDEAKMILCVSMRLLCFLGDYITSNYPHSSKYPYNVDFIEPNLSDWFMGDLKLHFQDFLEKKKFIKRLDLFSSNDSAVFSPIYIKYISMFDLPLNKQMYLISRMLQRE